MIYLLLSILSATAIYAVFRMFSHTGVRTFPAIVYNYLVAGAAGWLHGGAPEGEHFLAAPWWPFALLTGVIFITMFYLIALTAQRIGVSVSSIASKMSMVIPVVFFVIADTDETLSWMKALGIAFAVGGVILVSLKPRAQLDPGAYWWLPLVVFLGSGALDVVLANTQKDLLDTQPQIARFTAAGFSIAFILGTATLAIQKKAIRGRDLLAGIILGLVNYGSIYFLLMALRETEFQRSTLLPLNNLGIVSLSAIIAITIFREKMTPRNYLGLAFSIIAIAILYAL